MGKKKSERRRRRHGRARKLLLAAEEGDHHSQKPTISVELDDKEALLRHFASCNKRANQRKQVRHETQQSLSIAQKEQQVTGVVLRLSNLPFKASEHDIVTLMASCLTSRSHVLGCKLQFRRPKHPPNALPKPCGVAFVALVNESAADRVFASVHRGLMLAGRTIHAKIWNGQQALRFLRSVAWNAHDPGNTFSLESVRIGTQIQFPMMNESPFVYRWSNAESVKLSLEDESMCIVCANEFLMVEVRFLDTFKIVLNVDGDDKGKNMDNSSVKLRFCVRRPPRCYRRIRDRPTHNEELFMGHLEEWGRTVDVSLNGAFGLCSMMECVVATGNSLSESVIKNLSQVFRKKGLKFTIQRRYELPSLFENLDGSLQSKPPCNALDKFECTSSTIVEMCGCRDRMMYTLKFQQTLDCCAPNRDWAKVLLECFAKSPFRVRYFIHMLLSGGKLWFVTLNEAKRLSDEILKVLADGTVQPSDVCALMNDLFYCWGIPNPVKRLINALDELYKEHQEQQTEELEEIPPATDLETLRVFVTPLRVCPQPPAIEGDNRILRQFRQFGDRFIRVTFVDENFGPFHGCKSEDTMTNIVRRVLSEGVEVAGRKFVFLAYSNSQLRAQSCWFYDERRRSFAEDCGVNIVRAEDIRRQIGDLSSILVAAKFGARLGQAFSDTKSTVQVPKDRVSSTSDIERNDCCFTDGVGLISFSMAEQVSAKLETEEMPSAFQIRFAGAKGVVTVWPDHIIDRAVSGRRGCELVLRPSMTKFTGNPTHRDLEVCNVSGMRLCFLNHSMILLLSALGIEDRVFLTLLDDAINLLNAGLESEDGARQLVTLHGASTLALPMLLAGFDLSDELLFKLVVAIRDRCLLDIQRKARIYVPKGVRLIGVVDETGILPAGTVFFQVDGAERLSHGTRVVVGRSPCLHPGDIRVMAIHTVSVHDMEHLKNVVVFSSRGERPDCNMMGGGDLDGDEYFVIWDDQLIPDKSSDPMKYEHSGQHPKSVSSSSVTCQDIQNFFADYLQNDVLGLVSHAHLAWGDRNDEGPFSEQCTKLAEHHAVAVDFAKTGVPAKVPRELLHPPAYPHFMEKRFSYTSDKILGQIYNISVSTAFAKTKYQAGNSRGYDPKLVIDGHEDYYEDALELMGHYCWDLYAIAQQFGVSDEGELLSGHAHKLSRRAMRRHRGISEAANKLRYAVQQVQNRYADEFWAEFEEDADNDFVASSTSDAPWQVICKASAWYKCTYTWVYEDGFRPYLSFAWVARKPMVRLREIVYGNPAA